MKINVIGTSGSGKSTLSRQLAARLAIPYIEMDRLYWKANWGESSDEELFAAVEDALSVADWVTDGNYTRTQPIKWRDVDMIVWLDYSFTRTFYQAVKRAITRSWQQHEIWPGTGNRETFKKSFFSRDSIILWTLKTYAKNRKKYLALMANPAYQHIRFVHLRTPKQAQKFVEQLAVQQKK